GSASQRAERDRRRACESRATGRREAESPGESEACADCGWHAAGADGSGPRLNAYRTNCLHDASRSRPRGQVCTGPSVRAESGRRASVSGNARVRMAPQRVPPAAGARALGRRCIGKPTKPAQIEKSSEEARPRLAGPAGAPLAWQDAGATDSGVGPPQLTLFSSEKNLETAENATGLPTQFSIGPSAPSQGRDGQFTAGLGDQQTWRTPLPDRIWLSLPGRVGTAQTMTDPASRGLTVRVRPYIP